MPSPGRLLRLNPTVEYRFEGAESVVVKVRRGESLTRYAVNRAIYEFLERFREPASLEDVARAMTGQGYDAAQVLEFGRQLARTPLIEFHDPGAGEGEDVAGLLASLGYGLEVTYKQRKFDGVYKVRTESGVHRVVKLLHRVDASPARAIGRRLRNEYEILKRLHDVDGVVGVDNFRDGAAPCFEMDYIEGLPLNRRRGDDPAERLVKCREVARIVAAIHRHGIVHGDLHTSNFLAAADGRISIIDFDCSFVADDDYRPRVGGAIHFLPPERVMERWNQPSAVHADLASDIYQAAVILYAILSGDMPYRGATLGALAASIRTGRFRPLDTTTDTSAIPAAVTRFIHQALDPDPGARPRSMDEFPHVHE